MKTYKVHMSEISFYTVVVEVDDNATEEDIAKAAEEAFVQGDGEFVGCDDRKLEDFEEIKE